MAGLSTQCVRGGGCNGVARCRLCRVVPTLSGRARHTPIRPGECGSSVPLCRWSGGGRDGAEQPAHARINGPALRLAVLIFSIVSGAALVLKG